MTHRWILGDVETSGLDDGAGVVEVAWAEADENANVIAEAYSLINPGHPISPSASGIHGITNKDVEGSPSMADFVGDKLSEGDVVLIAHNVKFDERFFGPHIRSLAGTMCTLKLARYFYPDAENHKLATLRYMFDLDSGDSHSADGDVRALVALVRQMMADHHMTLLELWELSQKPIRISTMVFGKHKGRKLEELPKDYVRWLLDLPDLDENLRFSLNSL